jgi:multiple sugar transport system substrate-binding protein
MLMSIISFSCNNKNDGKITIDFWGLGSAGESLKKIVPEFEKNNPGIKVNVQMIPWTAAQEKLISAFAGDNTPDLCQLGNTWVPQFSQLNAIINLDPFIKKSLIVNKAKYFPGIWDTNVIDSLVFGIPWYIDTRVLYYRTDVIKKAGYNSPPKTWAQLYDLSKKIVENNKGKDKYAIYLPTNEWAPFVIFGLQNGSTILKDNNSRGNFSGKKFEEAFEYLVKFPREGLAPIGISQVTNVYQAFAEEYFSMYISGPWNIPEFKKWMKGDLKDKWMTAPMPSKDNDSIPGVSLAGGASLVIFKNSIHKEAAWKFIEFLSQTKTQINFYKLVNDLPAVTDAWEDTTFRDDPYMQAFYKQFFYVVATPKIPEWEQIVFSKLQQYAEEVVRGAMTTSEAMSDLDKDVDKILEKRRWLLSKGNK